MSNTNYGINFEKGNDGLLDCIIAYRLDGARRQVRKRGFKTQKDATPWIDEKLKELGLASVEEKRKRFLDKISEE